MAAPAEEDKSRSTRFAQIFSRLIDLPGYTWDTEIEPFHSVRMLEMQTLDPR
jgi:hypothetical protein